MEAVKRLLAARTILEKAAADFLDACATLKLVVVPSLATVPGQLELENHVDNILSSAESVLLVESYMHESGVALKKLLNMSTRRAPVNKLPAETLGYIFSIVTAITPCDSAGTQRDNVLDIPRVCIRWNQVATNTPSLWSHVDINLSRLSVATALSRARTRLDRCHGVPIHLHLDGGVSGFGQAHVQGITAAIQSYDGLLSSLVVSRSRSNSLPHALLNLVLGCTKPSSLKTLVLYDVGIIHNQETLSPMPLNLLCGLTVLDLYEVNGPICSSLVDFVKLLSGCCSTLHTLRLRGMPSSSGSVQAHPAIPLPQLRFLQISYVYGDEVLVLLSKLHPGVLELDVRLDAEYIADGADSPGQLLLARSNVVSLSINEFENVEDRQPLTYLASVPRLRVIRLNSTRLAWDFAVMLAWTTATYPRALPVPCLQSLYLVDCRIKVWVANLVGRILRRRNLRNLAFLRCLYPSSFAPPISTDQESESPPENDGNDEDDEDDDDDDNYYDYRKEMPSGMKEWFLERVGRVVIGEPSYDDQIYHGMDPFVQRLIDLE
ncbi:hypothetical protein FRC12_010032 [Ceratobasidium sp. 428]|nr:hypothetical protein FRC12_010032 [Ceratobasidium sp. 428]